MAGRSGCPGKCAVQAPRAGSLCQGEGRGSNPVFRSTEVLVRRPVRPTVGESTPSGPQKGTPTSLARVSSTSHQCVFVAVEQVLVALDGVLVSPKKVDSCFSLQPCSIRMAAAVWRKS